MKRCVLLFFSFLLFFPGWIYATTDITLWVTLTQSDRVKTIRLILDTFEALNDGISVKLIPIDENDIPKQVAAASVAGNLPEIIEMGSELAVAFGSEGLMDVKSNREIINEIGKDDFFKGALQLTSTPDGKSNYAIPFYGWIQGIWYRADWFKKAGLKPPTTWNTILKAARYFHKPQKNQYGILIGTKADAYAEQVFTQFAISNNAREFDSNGKLVFNSKAMVETLDFYKKLQKYSPPGPHNWRARDYYLQGKLAMFFYSTYIMDDLALAQVAANSLSNSNFKDLKGSQFDPNLVENTRMAAIIEKKQKSSYGAVVTLGVVKNKNAVKRSAAKKLIRYLFEEDAYITFLHMAPGGMNPVIRSIAKSETFINDPKNIFKRYGKDKIYEIISGLDNLQKFEIVNGKIFPASGEIFAKQIIPQMIFKTIFEGVPTQKAISWAEMEMNKVIAKK